MGRRIRAVLRPTPLPAEDRRVTLMQDHLYRTSVTHMAMGYGDNQPLTSYFVEEH